jgi:hypothetical protein
MNKTYIVARNYSQAWHYAREAKLSNWSYVVSADSLRGIRPLNLVYVGQWEKRNDIREIKCVEQTAKGNK